MNTLVLAGAGHGHINILRKLIKDKNYKFNNTKIKLITDNDLQFYSGMIPGFIEGIYDLEEISFNVPELCKRLGIEYIQEKIIEIDSIKKIVITENNAYPFDYISINVGSETKDIFDDKINNKNIIKVKPISNLVMLKTNLDKNYINNLVIIGSGASSIELALSISEKYKAVKINIISKSEDILKNFNNKSRKKAYEILKSRGVEILLQKDILNINNNEVMLNDYSMIKFDFCIIATGVKGQSIKYTNYQVTDNNFLVVDEHLFADKNTIAIGDMICIDKYDSLPKAGVIAIRQSPVLSENISNMVNKKEVKKFFTPRSNYLQILNIGNKKAIINYNNFTYQGKLAWYIKDIIDRHYMSL